MAPKAAQAAAAKKAKKQKKMLIVLGVLLVCALGYAVMTLSSLNSSPAAAAPSATGATPPAGSTSTGTPIVAVTPGIAAAPAGSLPAFSALGQKDPFNDGGPQPSSATSTTGTTSTTSSGAGSQQIADQSSKTSSNSAVSHDAGLRTAVLKPSQVAPGYQLKSGARSTCVQQCVTLDLCGFGFKSEADRTARFQVGYVKAPGDLALSNEVVRYRSGGTALALHELMQAAATCPHHAVTSSGAALGPVTWRIHRFTAPHLLKGAIALLMQVSGTAHGHAFTINGVAIYQVRGTILSSVYIVAPSSSDVSAAQNLAVHAAQASAANLVKAAKS